MQDEKIRADEAEPRHRPGHEDWSGREMSLGAKILNAAALLILLSLSVGFVWLMGSLPRIEGSYPVKGLELPASITRDHAGIPRISARNQHDAYFSLGWVHAQDRIWQMELQRRIGAGRLAEVVGEKGLANDRFMRTLGLYRLAQGSVERMDKSTRDGLTAYAEGVNAWLKEHSHRLPLEFRVLGVKPEPWTPADSLVWGRLMALQLVGNWRDEVLKAKLAGKLDGRRLGELFPAYPADAPVTLSAKAADALLAALPETAEPRLASNVWAVAGSMTETGKPLLANDPHLGFQAPVLWYLARIEAPGLTVTGATVPGVPFHLIGHNGRIAWGTTTTHADTVDLFVEKLAGEGSYQTVSGPKPFATRDEIIQVKDSAPVTLTVRETVHGPVVSDLLAKDLARTGQVIAFRSTALEPEDLTAQALMRMNRAIDWKSFQTALKDFHAPVQNFAFADTAGNIGFTVAGRVPQRRSGDGALPVEGWTGLGDWIGWVPQAKMPQSYNPRSGSVVNANNRVTPERAAAMISAAWPEGYRAQRIQDMLQGAKGLTLHAMARMQLDEMSLAALELKESLTGLEPKSAQAREAARLVAAWDGRMDRDRAEPLIFNAWMDHLWQAVFADELGDSFAQFRQLRPYVLGAALTSNRHWCDDVGTAEAESCEDVMAASLEKAVAALATRFGASMGKWKWGDAHQAALDSSVLGQVPLLSSLANKSIATGGDDFTINRGTWHQGNGEILYPHGHGPGLRVVYDLADLSRSRFIIATGQSGNPLSRNYSDLMEAWRDNQGLLLNRDGGTAVLNMEPGY